MDRNRKIKLLKGIASMLPREKEASRNYYSILGSDIKLTGLVVPSGMVIEDDKEYHYNESKFLESNHARRVLRAYKKSGKKGLLNYMLRYTLPGNKSKMSEIVNALPL